MLVCLFIMWLFCHIEWSSYWGRENGTPRGCDTLVNCTLVVTYSLLWNIDTILVNICHVILPYSKVGNILEGCAYTDDEHWLCRCSPLSWRVMTALIEVDRCWLLLIDVAVADLGVKNQLTPTKKPVIEQVRRWFQSTGKYQYQSTSVQSVVSCTVFTKYRHLWRST